MTITTYTYRNDEWIEAEPNEGERYKTVVDKGDKGQRIIEGIKRLPIVEKKITPKAFLSRFTASEYVSIDLASIDDPQSERAVREVAAMLRLYLIKINSAKFVDLNDTETVEGVNTLVQMGFITSERADEILNNPVDDNEIA